MRLKDEFIFCDMNNSRMQTSVGKTFRGLARANEPAAFIIDCLMEKTTREEIVAAMMERYEDAEETRVTADVDRLLAQLREIGALEE